MLNCTKPLVIVNNLKGIGVKPATASRVATLLFLLLINFIFRKKIVINSIKFKYFYPISLKKIYPTV